jgi:hypothetical protein
MGQMRDESLEQLLMLGEPEAVVAAVGSPGLTEELARRAWWAMEDAENARRMLENPGIVASTMGPVLADYLLEYLPFETETDKMTASIRLILQPGLITPEQREALWSKSARKQAYLLGFLQAVPDDLPEAVGPRADAERLAAALAAECDAGNRVARLLLRVTGAQGQTYLKTISTVLAKPPNQEVVSAAFDCLRAYFAPLRGDGDPRLSLDDLLADAADCVDGTKAADEVRACLAADSALREDVIAMRVLSGAGYGLIRPVLTDPTTLGSLMRRKLAPVIDALQAQIDQLRGAAA